jgi:hypothetical protein
MGTNIWRGLVMLLCPNCTETLEKNEKHGEGVWQCPNEDCGMTWFILDIQKPKYLRKKEKERKILEAPKEPDSFTKEQAKEAVEKVIKPRRHP